jgi:membrane protease YdiL (CAAX protease family)
MKEDVETRPVVMSIAVLLLALAGMTFPTEKWLTPLVGNFFALAVVRFAFAAAGVVFMLMLSLHRGLAFRRRIGRGADVFFVLLLVVVNNFPFIGLFRGEFVVTADAFSQIGYLAFCLSVGVFEEIFFRGLLYPLLKSALKTRRRYKQPAIVLCGVIFGLVHLVNLLGGAGVGPTFLQIGYCTLFGAAYAFLYELTDCLWLPVLLHTVFDVGGLLSGNVGGGVIWNLPTLILTAALGVLAAAYLLYRFFRFTRSATPKEPPTPPPPTKK